MEVNGQLLSLGDLPRRKPLVQTGAGWAPELVWAFWRREKLYTSARNRTPDRPVRILVAVVSTL
jgi:hypothetical protein